MTQAPVTEQPKGKEKASGEKQDKDTATVAVQIPANFKVILDEAAKSEKLTTAKYIRSHLARELNFDMSAFEQRTRTRASKYSTDEERNAAKKANAARRADTIKALMAKYKKGEISL